MCCNFTVRTTTASEISAHIIIEREALHKLEALGLIGYQTSYEFLTTQVATRRLILQPRRTPRTSVAAWCSAPRIGILGLALTLSSLRTRSQVKLLRQSSLLLKLEIGAYLALVIPLVRGPALASSMRCSCVSIKKEDICIHLRPSVDP